MHVIRNLDSYVATFKQLRGRADMIESKRNLDVFHRRTA